MYDLYKHRAGGMIFSVVLFGGAAVAMLAGGIHDLVVRGFSFNTIMFVISSAFLFFVAYVFCLAGKSNPYEWVEKTRQIDPQRVEAMEKDFESATKLLYNLWKGKDNYFFKGGDFFAIPIGKIRAMEVTEGYKRRIGSYLKCVIKSDEGMVDFDILMAIVKKEDALEILGQLAAESGIEVNHVN